MGNMFAANELIKALLHYSPDFIYFKDVHGKFVAVSDMCAPYSNTTVDEMIGKSESDFLPRELAESSYLKTKR